MRVFMAPPTSPSPSRKPRISMYWRILATVSSWMLLAGFLLFTVALETKCEMLRVDRLGLEIVAVALVGLPNVVSVSLVLMFREHHKFLFNRIYIPFFGSSLLGTFNAAIHILFRGLTPLSTVGLAYIILSSVSTAGYGLAAFCSYWKIDVGFSRRDKTPPTLDQQQQQRQPQWSPYWPPVTDDTRTALLNNIDDDELQRQQLLRLLRSNSADTPPSAELVKNTFRIELPEVVNPHRDQNRYAAVPGNAAYGPEGRYERQGSMERGV
ncbi:hypothetical protein VTN77DRAFT_9744 [Rasamsonia byssochlamydoides]|uniref:uncharacterized protein n=1 Tax=Rasamsonia byssochlamydoides TaxID=89139 RepID=UPI003743B0DC